MTLRQLLAQDRPCLGLYVCSADRNLIEIAADAHVDYIRIDLEHGLLSYAEVREIIRTATLCGMPVQARVSDLSDVTRLLDFGVTGIIVPDIETRQDAQQVVELVKYAPLGSRGFNNAPRFLRFNSEHFMEYLQTANQEVLLGVQLESKKALDNIDEILSLEGIDMVSSGKGDLSQSFGMLGQNTHPLILEKEAFIIQKAMDYHKIPTVLSINAQRTQELYKMGVKLLTIGSDMDIYSAALKGFVAQVSG